MANPEFKQCTINTLSTLVKQKGTRFFLKYSNGETKKYSKVDLKTFIRKTRKSDGDFTWLKAEKYDNVIYIIVED